MRARIEKESKDSGYKVHEPFLSRPENPTAAGRLASWWMTESPLLFSSPFRLAIWPRALLSFRAQKPDPNDYPYQARDAGLQEQRRVVANLNQTGD